MFPALLLLLLLLSLVSTVHATVTCLTTAECETALRPGSECVDGACTNPFTKGGCLANMLDGWTRPRVCHSEDPPYAAQSGYCRQPLDTQYTEVRIASQNWEGAILEAYLLQILLSELLDVPATIESGVAGTLDFYDAHMPLTFGTANDWGALRQSNTVDDCTEVAMQNLESDSDANYQSCAHVVPEVWGGNLQTVRELVDEGVVESPQGLGALGHQSLFVPKFTGLHDPTLASYMGLSGETNRRKLANTFLRPTAWGDYCQQVSTTNCTVDDGVAQRPPTLEQQDRYFVQDVYTGHFRATAENDCDLHPTTCTGHVADYPCGWSSFAKPQLYHHQIALQSSGKEPGSNGYSYQHLTDIWNAAHATHSHVMMQWWSPEALFQTFLGTEAEFQRVAMTPPTQDCMEQRIKTVDRCSSDLRQQVGDARGACDEAAHPLSKVIATSLYRISRDASIPEARRSPAYDAIKAFAITEFQVGKIFDYWFARKARDKWNYDPREATCQWFVENIDLMQTFVPRSYPRTFQEDSSTRAGPLFYVTLSLSAVAVLVVAVCAVLTYRQRKRRVIRYAQIEFLTLLLIGLSLLSMGAVLMALPPSHGLCLSTEWLINLGYTLELVPLIVKVATLNRLMNAAQQMRRIKLRKQSLFEAVFGLSAMAVIYMILWSVLDPPRRSVSYEVSGTELESGETVVTTSAFCSSSSDIWRYFSVSWYTLLLIAATVLAFQTRKLRQDFNETQTLAMMIYSHFVFVMLRLITYLLESNLKLIDTRRYQSLIFSCDAILTVVFYFLPKFLSSDAVGASTRALESQAAFHPVRHIVSITTRHSRVLSNHHSDQENDGDDTESDPSCGEQKGDGCSDMIVDKKRGEDKESDETIDTDDIEGQEECALEEPKQVAFEGIRCRHCGHVAGDTLSEDDLNGL